MMSFVADSYMLSTDIDVRVQSTSEVRSLKGFGVVVTQRLRDSDVGLNISCALGNKKDLLTQ